MNRNNSNFKLYEISGKLFDLKLLAHTEYIFQCIRGILAFFCLKELGNSFLYDFYYFVCVVRKKEI